jgi:molecular chaperone DnaJ
MLADEGKRKLYDQYGHQAVDETFGRQGFTWDQFTHYTDLEDLFGGFDFFGSDPFGVFGRRRRNPNGPARGKDLPYELIITLEEAAEGMDREINVPHSATCGECGGTGAEKGTSPKKCPRCGGAGQVQNVRTQGYSQFITIAPCSMCGGRGITLDRPCRQCRGTGLVPKEERMRITIPPGSDTGLRLRVPGRGEAGKRGGPPGDLYVIVHVRPHQQFQRDGNDLYTESEISFALAALGGELEVPTILDGKARITIPPATQTHTIFRLQGKGMPRFERSGRGDQFVRVRVVTPRELSDRQKELLREYALESGEPVEEKRGFFRKPGRR